MKTWSILFLILKASNFVHLDCGCNKLDRGEAHETFKNEVQSSDSCNAVNMDSQTKVENMALITGGTYTVGCSEEKEVFKTDRESPEKSVKVDDFYIDKYEVSNEVFKKFIEETSYKTDAEKFNDSFVFEQHLSQDVKQAYQDFRVVNALWWYKINGTNWKHPFGPQSSLKDIWDHPVVHVSWNDANAFCKWNGKRLPTEVEWEIACRGGRKNKLYPWGDKLLPKDEHRMNIWQGDFPYKNTKEDGYEGTNPVSKFSQNVYDLYNIVGNVWEWTADLWDLNDKTKIPNRVKKGGSYMCHKSYCYRYRCAARSQNTQDSSAENLGFRCVKNIKTF